MRKRPMCLACLGFMLVLVLLRIAGVPLGTPFSDPKYENKAQQGRKVWIAGTIETYEKKSSNNGYVLRGEGSKGKIYLLAKRGDLPVGAAVRVYGTVKKPESPRNPGMFDEKTYYEGKGCAFYVISEREEVVDAGRWNLGEALRLERERCCAVLKEMMPEEEAGVLSAMLLGERSELTEETYLAYQQSGLLHLISVSGMHLMLLGMALRRLLMALHLPKTPASLAAAAGMVLYGMFTGSGTATVRAVVMFAVRMGAVAVGRTYDSLSALSLAAILMLAENPSYLEQSGFWLSFGAVTAISGVCPVLTGEKTERKRRGEKTGLEKLAAKGKEAAMVYLSLQLVMIPLQAWYFYEIPLFAFLPNLFAGAVMTAVLLTGAAGLLAGLASVKAGSVVLLPARFLLTLLRQMTAAVAQIPGNVWICGQPEKWQMAGYGIILTGLLVILYVRKRKREMNPDGAKRTGAQARRRERMLFGITMFFACVLLFYRPRETFSITALDVGQGDSLVVESGRFVMLNDGGSSSASAIGEKRILPYLKQRGIAALDAVVITHPDAESHERNPRTAGADRGAENGASHPPSVPACVDERKRKRKSFYFSRTKSGNYGRISKKGRRDPCRRTHRIGTSSGSGRRLYGRGKRRKCCITAFLRCLPRTSDGRSGGKRRRRGPGGGRAVPDFKGGAPRLEKFNERGISEPHTAADQPDFLRVAGTVRPSAPGAAGAASCLQKPYLRNTGGWSRDSTAEA